MNKTDNIINLVDKFKLQETNKIIIRTNRDFQEKPYIERMILDKTDIDDFLNGLRRNRNLNDYIKTIVRYYVTFYKDGEEVLVFGINDLSGGEGSFIRVHSDKIGSDLLPDKSFIKTFHRLIVAGGRS